MTESNTVTTGKLIPRNDLGLNFDETQLHYLDTEFDVTATQEPDGATRFDVSVDHEPLNARKLVNLLNRLTRATNGPDSLGGIIADWDIVDRAKSPSAPKYATKLVDLHEQLGGSWNEFLKSRGRWLSILVNDNPPNFGSGVGMYGNPFRREDSTNLDIIVADTARAKADTVDALIAGFEATDVEDAAAVVIGGIQKSLNRNRHPQRQLSDEFKIRRHFGSINTQVRQEMIRRLVAGLDGDDVRPFIQAVSAQIYETLETDDGRFYIPKSLLTRPFDESMTSARNVRKGMFEAKIVDLFIERKHVHAVVPGSLKSDEPATFVAPLLSWRNQNGDRQFIIERRTEHDEALTFHDGVLGVMLAAYLSPEVTKDWPRRMSVRGSREQAIGVAQVPVLALMRQAQLLKTDFIEAAEASAQT